MWAALRFLHSETGCPACGSADTKLVKRKYIVTSLYECLNCSLRFRVPKDTVSQNKDFYQERYTAGFTTDCPNDDDLARLKETGFRGSVKDFSVYIEVLQAIGLPLGASVLDFGASWGYGSWQLGQAGFRVFSYEISIPRSRYAAEKLGCNTIGDIYQLPTKVDCFFSAHVIEHLPDPNILWKSARAVLKPEGVLVLFLPNGDPSRERNAHYHQIWGQVHPLVLTPRALDVLAARNGFVGRSYSSPYNLEEIKGGSSGQVGGNELLYIGQQNDGT